MAEWQKLANQAEAYKRRLHHALNTMPKVELAASRWQRQDSVFHSKQFCPIYHIKRVCSTQIASCMLGEERIHTQADISKLSIMTFGSWFWDY